jgi:hypothetical protein
VKKFITANKSAEIREKLMRSFEVNSTEIVEDAFGNYAVQYAIDNYGPEVCYNLIEHVIQNLLSFANQKFSSNVVEKCIQVVDRVNIEYKLIFSFNFLGSFCQNH